jgi:hypothetical protein
VTEFNRSLTCPICSDDDDDGDDDNYDDVDDDADDDEDDEVNDEVYFNKTTRYTYIHL